MALGNNSRVRAADRVEGAPFLVAPLVVIVLAQIGTSSDNAALGIAVQQLVGALGATVADVQMANLAYSLIAGSFMIAGGMVGVVVGWRKTLRIGLVLAILGEIVVALSPNMGVFTWGGRSIVGLGASFITPSVLGLIPALYEGRARATAFGFVAAASAVSALVPIPFGLLLDTAGFRVTFGVIAAYFAIVLVCTRLLPNLSKPDASMSIDVGGIVLAASGLAFLLFGIARVSSWGFVEPLSECPFTIGGIAPTLPAIATGLCLLTCLVLFERRRESQGKAALLPRAFVDAPCVRAGLLAVGVPLFCMGAQGIIVTPYLQLVAGFSALQTGLLSLLSGIPMLLCAMLVPKLVKKTRPRLVIRVGYGLIIAGACSMALSFEPHGVTPLLFFATSLVGAGLGVVNSQANNAVASVVDPVAAQQSGGIQGTARNVGMALGTAIMGSLLLVTMQVGASAELSALEGDAVGSAAVMVQEEISFCDDATYEEFAVRSGVEGGDEKVVVESLAAARCNAASVSMFVLAGIVGVAFIGTRHIVRELQG
ncbi:MFS transporter [Paraeggerthella hongkongensis]|uniref:MFS transporter n=1 Tax=Paraeggerthella hominis TaxID=2897351 RepID=UPI001C118D19|nr:MFS transporter [Paraeggerthella hongkongensis]MCD2432731.1 MFS transporter [Paraeggerthella hominis]